MAPPTVINRIHQTAKRTTCEQHREEARKTLDFLRRRHLGQESGWKWGQGLSREGVLLWLMHS